MGGELERVSVWVPPAGWRPPATKALRFLHALVCVVAETIERVERERADVVDGVVVDED